MNSIGVRKTVKLPPRLALQTFVRFTSHHWTLQNIIIHIIIIIDHDITEAFVIQYYIVMYTDCVR